MDKNEFIRLYVKIVLKCNHFEYILFIHHAPRTSLNIIKIKFRLHFGVGVLRAKWESASCCRCESFCVDCWVSECLYAV